MELAGHEQLVVEVLGTPLTLIVTHRTAVVFGAVNSKRMVLATRPLLW
jgi:hypothetical protein